MGSDGVVENKNNWIEREEVPLEQLVNDFSKFVEAIRCRYVDKDYFTRLKSNDERVRYCLEKKEVQDGFDLFINACSSVAEVKNDEKAKSYRLEGNKFFKLKNNEEALKYYSMALLCASFDQIEHKTSSELALAFANRSAVLFRLNLFKECLISIDNAIKFGYPNSQLHTLLRKALCLKALQDMDLAEATLKKALKHSEHLNEDEEEVSKNHLTLSETSINKSNDIKTFIQNSFNEFKIQAQPSIEEEYFKSLETEIHCNEELASANDFIKLCYSSKKGRHLKVIKNVTRDTTLIVEKPFASILNPQFDNEFCHHCCTELRGKIYPCRSCSFVQFCSQDCAQEAFEEYHRYECGNLNLLHSTGTIRLALRIILIAKVENAISIAKDYCPSINKKSQLNDYKSILNLVNHSEKYTFITLSRQTLVACFLLYLLSKRMKLIESSHSDYFFLGGLILKHIQQISINSVVIFYQPLVPGPYGMVGVDVKNKIIARGLYSTLSLVNHSCLPNSESLFNGRKLILKSKQPILAGESITFSYGALYHKMSRIERLGMLKSQYYFDCDCKACFISKDSLKSPIGFLYADALLCNQCKGPFIVYGPLTYDGICLQCNSTKINSDDFTVQISNGKKLLNYGKSFIHTGKINEGEKQLQRALQCFNRFCFRDNRILLNIYNELYYSHILLENFDIAKRYGEECNRIKKQIFGEESPAFVASLLQLVNLKWAQLKNPAKKVAGANNRSSSMNKKLLQKLLNEIEDARIKTRKVLENFETRKGFLLLDPFVCLCLKELIELEKIQKQMTK